MPIRESHFNGLSSVIHIEIERIASAAAGRVKVRPVGRKICRQQIFFVLPDNFFGEKRQFFKIADCADIVRNKAFLQEHLSIVRDIRITMPDQSSKHLFLICDQFF